MRIGSAYGVPIYLDYSFIIIFALIVWSVGFVYMPAAYPKLSDFDYLAIGLFSAILLFASILIHELAHSVVAKRHGLRIGRIRLFLFGGVSEMEGQPNDPVVELKMSAAGPLTSIAIAIVCGGLWFASTSAKASALVQAPLYYSFLVNAIVAAFNLIPAFPMDGGRILRALLWRSNHDMIRSTKTAATVGKIFAYVLMIGGIASSFVYNFFTGLWLVLIGYFVYSGAGTELNQTLVQRDLAKLTARNMMTRSVDSVSPETTLSDIANKLEDSRYDGYAVIDSSGDFVGYVNRESIRRVKKDKRSSTAVREVMIPRENIPAIKESDPALETLQLMNSNNNRSGVIVVLDDASGRFAGVISRGDIIRTIQAEENSLSSGAAGPDYSKLISVEQGMLFELETTRDDGTEWSANFSSQEFALISERILQLSDGGQIKQFTFQPLMKGKFVITLSPAREQIGISKFPRQQQLTYTIIVK